MTVQVGKLTVRTAQGGAARDAGFRVRTESLLRSLELQPPGLPERAILIVRRMELAQVDGSTAQRTRAALADLRRRAARPPAGPVDGSAGAVLFDDQVELLTCLTADLVHGTACARWYWREIIPAVSVEGAGGGAALADTWISRVRWLPASLARLPGPVAHEAVSLLSQPDISRVLRAMLGGFGVGERPLLLPPPGSATSMARGRGPADPPWRRWLPATTLRPHAEALLGVALSLHHAPALVRRPVYAERLAAWWASADEDTCHLALPGESLRPGATPGEASDPGVSPRPGATSGEAVDPGAPPAESPRPGATSEAAPQPGTSARTAPPGAIQSTSSRPGRTNPGAERPAPRSPTPALQTESAAADTTVPITSEPSIPEPAGIPRPGADRLRPGGSTARREVPPEPPGNGDVHDFGTPMPEAEGIATGLASLLFLVNFVVWLDAEEGPPLPTGWALVELLGRHLLGAQLSDCAADPLWGVLAELDGRRPGTLPGVELEAAAPLRLPRAWLRRWPPPDRTYIAHWDSDRLMVRHLEAGFAVADVPCPAHRADEAAAAEAARLEDADVIVDGSVAGAAPTPGRRFGETVGAFVSWLLRARGIAVSSLMSPGLVRVTSTHIDVVLSLEDVDLAVRLAGLDRDPGWVPLLGRIVLFHFLETL